MVTFKLLHVADRPGSLGLLSKMYYLYLDTVCLLVYVHTVCV